MGTQGTGFFLYLSIFDITYWRTQLTHSKDPSDSEDFHFIFTSNAVVMRKDLMTLFNDNAYEEDFDVCRPSSLLTPSRSLISALLSSNCSGTNISYVFTSPVYA